MDRTNDLIQAVSSYCTQQGYTQEQTAKVKSAVILKPTRKLSDFNTVVTSVVQSISSLKDFIRLHQRDYLAPGAYSAAQKDQIEAEVGLFVKTCTQQIERLKASVLAAQERHGQQGGLSPQNIAHLHGVVLILAEQLRDVSARFDRCRAARYQELLRKEAGKRSPAKKQVSASGGTISHSSSMGNGHSPWSSSQQQPQPGMGSSGSMQQQALQAESRSLVDSLVARASQVTTLERGMREIATLHQMFSTAVQHQAEAIEMIYESAVQASENFVAGNEELRKAIEVNKSSRKYILVLLLVASFGLLFYDWFNS